MVATYADDAAGTGTLTELHTWWNILHDMSPQFGYFVNSFNTFLIVNLPLARSIFGGTRIIFSSLLRADDIWALLLAYICM